MKKVFYRCNICGTIIGMMHDGGGTLVCCADDMEELTVNTSDGAKEKHVPEVKIEGDTLYVSVGDVEHPMTKEHYIQWILIVQDGKTQRVELSPDSEPKATFKIEEGKPIEVYEYCNLHGLWAKEI